MDLEATTALVHRHLADYDIAARVNTIRYPRAGAVTYIEGVRDLVAVVEALRELDNVGAIGRAPRYVYIQWSR